MSQISASDDQIGKLNDVPVERCTIYDALVRDAMRWRKQQIDADGAEGREAVIEECARVAENVRDGYSANIRTSENEQEFSRDPDGPWVLNIDVALAIRALLINNS